jgi:hypothetical protein
VKEWISLEWVSSEWALRLNQKGKEGKMKRE